LTPSRGIGHAVGGSLIATGFRMRVVAPLLALVALVVAVPADASPIGVTILSAEFATTVSITENSGLATTRSTFSSAPTTDSLTVPVSSVVQAQFPGIPPEVGAFADSGLLRVATDTTSFSLLTPLYSSMSVAGANLLFSPVVDGIATFGIDLTVGGSAPDWSEGSVRLIDVSVGQELWAYGWDFSIARVSEVDPFEVIFGTPLFLSALYGVDVLNVETALQASHQYALTLSLLSQSQNDSQHVSIDVTGIHAVSEPDTIALLFLGMIGIGVGKVRIRRPINLGSR
jgi:hypothetical protein